MLANAMYVALTADYRTSVANDSYLGLTSHVITSPWELRSAELGVKVIEDRHYHFSLR